MIEATGPIVFLVGRGEHDHGEVTVDYWPICRPIAVCPWCKGDTKSHSLECKRPTYDTISEKAFLLGLREHELDTLRAFAVLAPSDEREHYWLVCKRSACGMLFHVRRPPAFAVVHVFEHVKPIASDRPIEVRPEGLCVGDWCSLENHNVAHQRDSRWW